MAREVLDVLERIVWRRGCYSSRWKEKGSLGSVWHCMLEDQDAWSISANSVQEVLSSGYV